MERFFKRFQWLDYYKYFEVISVWLLNKMIDLFCSNGFFKCRWEKLHKTELYSFSSKDKYLLIIIIDCFIDKMLREILNSTYKFWIDKYFMFDVWKLRYIYIRVNSNELVKNNNK